LAQETFVAILRGVQIRTARDVPHVPFWNCIQDSGQ
jgi:hypothetical protein